MANSCPFFWFYLAGTTFALEIFVDLQNGTGNSSCWTGGRDIPCNKLTLGLEGLLHYNHSTLWLRPDNYSITKQDTSRNGGNFKFMWMTNISIRGEAPQLASGQPVIECNSTSGFSFINSVDIVISGIKFFGCGVNQVTTSKYPTDTTSFIESKFAIYFLFCSNVILEHVTVQDSPGTGVVMYGAVGDIEITNCSFVSNAVMDDDFGGGGLYIEFPYCNPSITDDQSNCGNSSNVPVEFVINSTYKITKCLFNDNIARTPNAENNTFILPHWENHLAFGRGGGLSVFFKGLSNHNHIHVSNCTFMNNRALWGGGLFVEFQDSSSLNSFAVEFSSFFGNENFHKSNPTKGTGGGGARIGFISVDKADIMYNNFTFIDVHFENNKAYFGGGLSFYTSKEDDYKATNSLEFQHCSWKENVARVGSAVDLALWHASKSGIAVPVTFTNCNFFKNTASYNEGSGTYTVGVGALYSDSILIHFWGYVQFSSNQYSALACIGSVIIFERGCNAIFSNNSGRHGGAIALMGLAHIEVFDGTMIQFINNSASVKGGAIYGESVGEHDLISSRNCFIKYFDINVVPLEWNSTFIFINNTANSKSNSIFATSLLSCWWGGAFGSTSEDAADQVFCWNDNTVDSNKWIYSTNCSNEISTAPSTFKLSNTSESDPISVFPGISKSLPLYMFDDRDHDVTSLTVMTATLLNKSDSSAYVDRSSLYISDNAVKLHGKPNSIAEVKLETIDPRVVSYLFKVNFSDCPQGMVFDSGENNVSECRCLGKSMYGSLVRCDYRQSLLLRSAWFGKINSSEHLYVAALCPYTAPLTSNNWYELPRTYEDMCAKVNRTGVLCGRCNNSFGPVVNKGQSSKCIRCPSHVASYHWILFIVSEYVPTFIFFLIVVLFNISVTSGPANSFVFFAQILTTVYEIDGDGVIQLKNITHNTSDTLKAVYTVPYDIWNLKFFQPLLPELCISSTITPLQMITMGYLTAFFPLLLVMLFSLFVWAYGKGFAPVVCICRPLHKLSSRFRSMWNLQDSITHALATFILVSYSRFSLVSFLLLTFAPLYSSDSSASYHVLYYDGTIGYFSLAHFPYLITSLLVLLTFVAIPPTLLMAPSAILLIKKIGRKFTPRFQFNSVLEPGPLLSQFLNSFHGCYKDGTGGENGNVDYRWFAGLYFLFRVAIFFVFAFAPNWYLQYVMQQIVCVLALMAFVAFRPYKRNLFNLLDATVLAIMVVISTLSMYNYYLTKLNESLSIWAFTVQYILIFIPLVYISVYCAFSLWKRIRQYQLSSCLMRKRLHEIAGLLNNNDDDILDATSRRSSEVETASLERSTISSSAKSTTNSNPTNSYNSENTDPLARVPKVTNYGATA